MADEQPSGDPLQPEQVQRHRSKYDLAERTAKFGESVIGFVKHVQLTAVTSPLVKQLVRSATSVGANYCEADEAGSTKEFRYRISVCNRETRETMHWLRMIVAAVPEIAVAARCLWKEAAELNRIFSSIYHKTGKRK